MSMESLMNKSWFVVLISAFTDGIVTFMTTLLASMEATGKGEIPNKAAVLVAIMGGGLIIMRTIQQTVRSYGDMIGFQVPGQSQQIQRMISSGTLRGLQTSGQLMQQDQDVPNETLPKVKPLQKKNTGLSIMPDNVTIAPLSSFMTINGVKEQLDATDLIEGIYYEAIIAAAGYRPDQNVSVTYSHAKGPHTEGTLSAGEKFTPLYEGTAINAVITGSA